MSVNVSNQETELDKVKKCLTDLSYTDPDALIQHSISLLITFSNFKLQLSTVEKNNIEYQLAQISGPGYTSLQRDDIPPFLIHLWLDRGYPLQPPDVTLTDLAIPDQYLQPFYNPDTNKIEYSVFYEWNRDSSLTELLSAVKKVLAHTSIAWVLQITQQAQRQSPQELPHQMNAFNQPFMYPPRPSYSNGAAPYPPPSRYPHSQRFTSHYTEHEQPVYHPQAKTQRSADGTHKQRDPRKRGSRHNRKNRQREKYSDSEITKEQMQEDLNELDSVEKSAPSVDKVQSVAGQSQSKYKSTADAVKREPCEGKHLSYGKQTNNKSLTTTTTNTHATNE